MPTEPAITVQPDFLDEAEQTRLFAYLRDTIPWQHKTIRVFGREHREPRQTCWMGDADAVYAYSGVTNHPQPWLEPVAALRDAVADSARTRFNSVLLNHYRHGQDSMGWHSDDERELGPQPVIASLSLGGTRRFVLRRKRDHSDKREYALTGGSLLVMRGDTQHDWQHAVPKTAKPVAPRINLTFRHVRQISQIRGA